jgi:outer membrane lipoprotein-sorting protein
MTSRSGSPHGRLAAAVLVGGLLAAPGAPAAPPAPAAPSEKPAPSPTVDEIVGRYVTARGGLQKLRDLRTLRQEGRVHAGAGREGLVTREIKRPGKIRFEFTVQGVTSVFASDGQRGWKVSPLEGEMGPRPLPDEVLVDAREQADIDGPLVDWKSKGSQVELVGREAVDGHDAYKLKLTLKSGGVLTAWVDAKSASLIRTEATRQVRGKQVRIETTFGDFRKTGGILFPHLVEVRAAGRPQVLKIVVDKVEVNPPLSDARFTPPV